MVVVAGIDVSKATLEVSISEGPVLSFENSATGIRRLLRHMKRTGVTKAVCESTGGYERLVVGKLRETAHVAVQRKCPLKCPAKMSSRNFPCYQTKMPLTPGARVT